MEGLNFDDRIDTLVLYIEIPLRLNLLKDMLIENLNHDEKWKIVTSAEIKIYSMRHVQLNTTNCSGNFFKKLNMLTSCLISKILIKKISTGSSAYNRIYSTLHGIFLLFCNNIYMYIKKWLRMCHLSRADLTEAESRIETLCEAQWSPENENQTNCFMVQYFNENLNNGV